MDSIEKGLVIDGVFYSVPALRILRGVYLNVQPGSVCALFGRNGSGKTTLLKVAAGQVHADSGIVVVDGVRFYKPSIRDRFGLIAYLPQDSMVPSELPVRSLLKIFRAPDHLRDEPNIKQMLPLRFMQLSGGQKRYLELSLLLCLNRKYILLDEPFTGIEPRIIDELLRLIRAAAKKGIGFLITDHYYQYMLEVADDAYLMFNEQCRRLDPGRDFAHQLRSLGYMHNSP